MSTLPPPPADEPTLVTLPPPHETLPPPFDPGTTPDALPRVPGYDILGVLGRGGMGAVYSARQVRTDRVVALKLPYAASGPELRTRFRAEAKAVARVQHPHIVQVFEVGETDQAPFMALEFCPGGSLADRLDGTPLPPRPAAELVATLARAVAAAHAAGVVHRDLKPANILFGTADALLPKVADFGLARTLSTPDARTVTGAVLGTPCYMAPEQAGGGKQVGPPADIYALGAVLYELLTGRPPFRGATALETLDLLATQEPVPPSRLQPRLPRDLETVVLKCLQKPPDRRYPSADALADDLDRFLAGRPVLARPVGWPERLAKRVRRNPLASLLLALLAGAVAAGVGVGVWEQVRLTAERDRARAHYRMSVRAVESLLADVAGPDPAAAPLAEKTRQAVLEKALRYYRAILDLDAGDDPEVAWEAARAARRVGDILRLLGRHPEAVTAYTQATDRLDRLKADDRDDPEVWREVALVHTGQGEAYRLSDRFDEADAAYQAAAAIQTRLRAADPAHPGYALELAESLHNRGVVARDRGRLDDADSRFREAAAALPADPTRPDHRRQAARTAREWSDVLQRTVRPADAVAAATTAVATLDALLIADPTRPNDQHERAAAGIHLANALAAAGEPARARATAADARQRLTALVRDFPTAVPFRADLARACTTLGGLEPGSDEASARDAVGHWEAVLAVRPTVPAYHGGLGVALGRLGGVTKDRPAESRGHLLRGTAEVLVALRANPDDPDLRQSLRQQTRDLAENLLPAFRAILAKPGR